MMICYVLSHRNVNDKQMETETGDRKQIAENSHEPRMHPDRVRLNRLASNDLFLSDDRSVNSSPLSPHSRSNFSRIAPPKGDMKSQSHMLMVLSAL